MCDIYILLKHKLPRIFSPFLKWELSKFKLNYFYHFNNERINYLHIGKGIFVLTVEFNDHLLMKLDVSINKICNYFIPIVPSDLFTVLPLPYFFILRLRTLWAWSTLNLELLPWITIRNYRIITNNCLLGLYRVPYFLTSLNPNWKLPDFYLTTQHSILFRS